MIEHHEEIIETWLEQNPDCIVDGGGLLIVGRQVTTNLNCSIDLLGIDREGKVAVVELKRDKTPRDTLAQALEYTSFAATLSSDQLEEIYQLYNGDDNAFSEIWSDDLHKLVKNLKNCKPVGWKMDRRTLPIFP